MAARQRTFQMADWTPSQRTVSRQFYDMVQGGAVGAVLVTTPIKGNSPGEYRGALRWAKDLDARNVAHGQHRFLGGIHAAYRGTVVMFSVARANALQKGNALGLGAVRGARNVARILTPTTGVGERWASCITAAACR